MSKHETVTKGYIKRIQIIEQLEEYQSKEDFHGGPGLYPKERILAETEIKIAFNDLKHELKVNA
jgi:hypothetical protein